MEVHPIISAPDRPGKSSTKGDAISDDHALIPAGNGSYHFIPAASRQCTPDHCIMSGIAHAARVAAQAQNKGSQRLTLEQAGMRHTSLAREHEVICEHARVSSIARIMKSILPATRRSPWPTILLLLLKAGSTLNQLDKGLAPGSVIAIHIGYVVLISG